jgi:hypothetical protein
MKRHAFKLAILLSGLLLASTPCMFGSTERTALQKAPGANPAKSLAALAPREAARQKADAYLAKFNAWLQGQNQSFEPVLAQGQEAVAAILAVANELDDAAFDEFKQKMPGYLVVNDAVIAIVPDAPHLAEQAKTHGRTEDVAFFKLMAQTLNGYWPVTQEQLEDMSGCTRFGSHDLVRLYGAWKQFQQLYPKAYAGFIKDPGFLLLADIEDQLLNSQSACDGPDAVTDELETFINAYPTSPLTPKIRKRLQEVQNKHSGMAFFQGVKYIDPAEKE